MASNAESIMSMKRKKSMRNGSELDADAKVLSVVTQSTMDSHISNIQSSAPSSIRSELNAQNSSFQASQTGEKRRESIKSESTVEASDSKLKAADSKRKSSIGGSTKSTINATNDAKTSSKLNVESASPASGVTSASSAALSPTYSKGSSTNLEKGLSKCKKLLNVKDYLKISLIAGGVIILLITLMIFLAKPFKSPTKVYESSSMTTPNENVKEIAQTEWPDYSDPKSARKFNLMKDDYELFEKYLKQGSKKRKIL